MSIFRFDTQLRVGESGERWFAEHYADPDGGSLRPTPKEVRTHDLELVSSDGINTERIELKTDTYPLSKTPNFFFERYSSIDSGTLGGPWRAAADGIHRLFYLYLSDGKWYEFRDIPLLIETVEAWVEKNKPRVKYIKNQRWTTVGYAVPRSEVEHLAIIGGK